MQLTAWATLAILGVYFWTGVMAGWARVKYKVPAPSMDGPLPFQSAQRVQANTLEQLPLVLAPLWLCGHFLGDAWAAAGGLAWCLGRSRVRDRDAGMRCARGRQCGRIVAATINVALR